jgi:hypothetical protein
MNISQELNTYNGNRRDSETLSNFADTINVVNNTTTGDNIFAIADNGGDDIRPLYTIDESANQNK